MTEQLRLNKFLAERLGLSRREADDAIAAGRVTIDDKVAELGARLDLAKTSRPENVVPEAKLAEGEGAPRKDGRATGFEGEKFLPEIKLDGKLVPFEAQYIYLAMNKPIGYVCSRRAQGSAPTIYELLPKKYQHLKTVGRLDKDSSGLILLTNDGDFAYEHTHPKFAKEKLYEVTLNQPLAPLHQQMISDFGVLLDDGPSKFTVIHNDNKYLVILREGRNRQIRRTFAALGYAVKTLHRTQFGKYQLNDLKPGEFTEFIP